MYIKICYTGGSVDFSCVAEGSPTPQVHKDQTKLNQIKTKLNQQNKKQLQNQTNHKQKKHKTKPIINQPNQTQYITKPNTNQQNQTQHKPTKPNTILT